MARGWPGPAAAILLLCAPAAGCGPTAEDGAHRRAEEAAGEAIATTIHPESPEDALGDLEVARKWLRGGGDGKE